MHIQHYMNDGAHPQARGVLCALLWHLGGGIESSWNSVRNVYDAEIEVDRWHNCREQGYIASLRFSSGRKLHQLNIAWFEHRNSDQVHAVKWEQVSINPLTTSSAEFGDVYASKYDTSHSVGPGEWASMGEWIKDQFEAFWDLHHAETSQGAGTSA